MEVRQDCPNFPPSYLTIFCHEAFPSWSVRQTLARRAVLGPNPGRERDDINLGLLIEGQSVKPTTTMKSLSGSLRIVVLAAVGIGLALTIVSFAQTRPAPNSYVLMLKDNVPVKDKAKFEAAMKKNTKDKMKWKDERGMVTDVPSGITLNAPRSQDIQTTQVKSFDNTERGRLTAIAVHVTIQAAFNTSGGLKEVVDTLE
jgi:hypothetical protein